MTRWKYWMWWWKWNTVKCLNGLKVTKYSSPILILPVDLLLRLTCHPTTTLKCVLPKTSMIIPAHLSQRSLARNQLLLLMVHDAWRGKHVLVHVKLRKDQNFAVQHLACIILTASYTHVLQDTKVLNAPPSIQL